MVVSSVNIKMVDCAIVKCQISIFIYLFIYIYGPRRAETWHLAYADNEGPDQTAHPRSLIRAFIIR